MLHSEIKCRCPLQCLISRPLSGFSVANAIRYQPPHKLQISAMSPEAGQQTQHMTAAPQDTHTWCCYRKRGSGRARCKVRGVGCGVRGAGGGRARRCHVLRLICVRFMPVPLTDLGWGVASRDWSDTESVVTGHRARWEWHGERAQTKAHACVVFLSVSKKKKTVHDLCSCHYRNRIDSNIVHIHTVQLETTSISLSHTLTLSAESACEVSVSFVQWVLQACEKVEVNLGIRMSSAGIKAVLYSRADSWHPFLWDGFRVWTRSAVLGGSLTWRVLALNRPICYHSPLNLRPLRHFDKDRPQSFLKPPSLTPIAWYQIWEMLGTRSATVCKMTPWIWYTNAVCKEKGMPLFWY